jgi:nucleotide-binding universal stress UspA family protein
MPGQHLTSVVLEFAEDDDKVQLPEEVVHLRDWHFYRHFLEDANPPYTDQEIERYTEAWSQPGASAGMINYYRASVRHSQKEAAARPGSAKKKKYQDFRSWFGWCSPCVRQATDIASRERARLRLVAAYPDPQVLREKFTGGATAQNVDLRGVAIAVLKRAQHYVRDQGVELDTHTREGDPAEVIIEVANEQQADLIVVGSRGLTGIKRFLLGSVSNKVSHHAPCSVMIVRRA